MKIISWNCQMALRKKLEPIQIQQPDIFVVPESEHPDKINFEKYDLSCAEAVWVGDNLNKGLGIYSFSDMKLSLHESYTDKFRHIAPVTVTTDEEDFMLLAVWAMLCKEDRNQRYIGQVYRALQYYQNLIDEKTIIIGDFNWNINFDKDKKTENFKDVVELLKVHNIHSVYHHQNNEDMGQETFNTFYMHKNLEKGYHIDYCFVSSGRLSETKIEVKKYSVIKSVSDHTYLSIEF
ncbi:endonuclease/exonuclease/phosphatase family protein [Maridesulfovibrio zosterae]|uniref:endonuclease/exonuclease/phosphatase family protein n=1 Tax=Maridesulfovibrio zosterae TaxID=82171 RepID=UPI000487BF62|nr:endonuclease/exonuclease/phosphatase family protein [Maridesulfovibrio zosterae]